MYPSPGGSGLDCRRPSCWETRCPSCLLSSPIPLHLAGVCHLSELPSSPCIASPLLLGPVPIVNTLADSNVLSHRTSLPLKSQVIRDFRSSFEASRTLQEFESRAAFSPRPLSLWPLTSKVPTAHPNSSKKKINPGSPGRLFVVPLWCAPSVPRGVLQKEHCS